MTTRGVDGEAILKERDRLRMKEANSPAFRSSESSAGMQKLADDDYSGGDMNPNDKANYNKAKHEKYLAMSRDEKMETAYNSMRKRGASEQNISTLKDLRAKSKARTEEKFKKNKRYTNLSGKALQKARARYGLD